MNPSNRKCQDSTGSRARSSTPRSGPTTTTSAESAVAVIGSAASAVQLIPEIAPIVASLDVYQRTANWVSPKDDDPYSEDELARIRGRRRGGARGAGRDLHHHRPQPHVLRRRAAHPLRGVRAAQHRAGRGRGAARSTDPSRTVRLQAPPGVEPLLPHVQPAARRARHRRHHRGHRARHRLRRRHDPRGRHHHPRHRVHHHQVPRRARRDRPQGSRHRRRVGRRPAGVPGHHHQRLPERVHALRAEHQQRVDHLHDRVPGALCHGDARCHGRRTTSPGST